MARVTSRRSTPAAACGAIVRGGLGPGKTPRPMAMNRRAADGQAAEAIASRHLEAHGLRILARNYRCRAGEIDIVAQDGDTLVFAEVRYRASSTYGGAAASVDGRKQAKIVRAAQHYLAGRRECACRFDVVLLERLDALAVEWIRDAFSV
jgi:putative endonuclease